MKLLSAAATLLLVNGAAAVTCPELKSSYSLTDEGTFYYAIATQNGGDSYLCGRVESSKGGWVAFAVQSSDAQDASGGKRMDGAQAVIGSPDAGTVLKYNMGAGGGVAVMEDGMQTLVDTEITQSDGVTKMTFAKLLVESGEHEILASGENTFLYALGADNNVGYHGYGEEFRGLFTLDFGAEVSVGTTPAPSAPGDEISIPGGKTMSPTPGMDRPSPPADTPAPTPEAPTPPSPTNPPSGAMSNSKIGTAIMGAGVIAAWFGGMM